MTKRQIKDIATSVRQRLLNNARATDRPFQEVLQYFAMERFLYRLAQSRYADTFVLKGALMLTVWRAPATRPTKDIDLLARMDNNVEAVTAVIRHVCEQDVEPDGLVFDVRSVRGMVIKEEADYEGVRIALLGKLQNARLSMQIDVGFGDVIVPSASIAQYPTILDMAPPKLYGYSRETTVAEKFEALVKLGQLNSRMKDYFDIWLLSRRFDFDGLTLAKAIESTFANRGTTVAKEPVGLTPAFASDRTKQAQWNAFLRKLRSDLATLDLEQVIETMADFLRPVAEAVRKRQEFDFFWQAPGPWKRGPD
ncbi:MAG: nucleotidyl transferase AbiEii/AbiGii toxin family protein [Planctomycetota bacterium]|nr:nucleotidyl transferase AbiEii/AbiGii toxin family protein [Planctomycetota bacterium]